MTTAGEAFRAGDLAGAIAVAQAAVKAAPRDAGARWLLAEFLLLAGDAERADRILDAAALDAPSPAVLEFRALLRAEVARQQVWAEGRAPRLSGDAATPAQAAVLRAAMLHRAGDAPGALAAAEEAETLRPRLPGEATLLDGTTRSFADLRDADDLAAPLVEVLTAAGEHLLVPLERVASLEFDAPRRPRDLCWRPAGIVLRDGKEGRVFVPAIYPGAAALPDALRLGRATEWSGGPGPVQGRGQRLLLLDEEALPLSALASLRLSP